MPERWGCSLFLDELACVRTYLATTFGWDRLHPQVRAGVACWA